MTGHVTIVGCGLHPDDVTAKHHAAVAEADVLAGGDRLLAWFPDFAGTKISLGAGMAKAADDLVARAETQKVTVLASGDALFFGAARLFIQRMSPQTLTILPNITAAQAACARLHLPWHNTAFFSVHGRSTLLPWRDVLRAESAVVYCDGTRSPAQVAQELVARFPGAASRPAAVADNLGGEEEKVEQATLQELTSICCSSLSMLVLLNRDDQRNAQTPPPAFGLPSEAYEHERGMITNPEIRAVVLSKLQLRGGVLWDLGAGSGSVGIEAASVCNDLRVYAVESKPERCRQIETNVARFGCPRVNVWETEILGAIEDLPAPDAVFIGGGGRNATAIAENAFAKLRVNGRMVAVAVMEETRQALQDALPAENREVLELNVRRSAKLGPGSMMKPDNPVGIFVYEG